MTDLSVQPNCPQHGSAMCSHQDWIRSPVSRTFFRFVAGGKEILFPAVGSVPVLIITEAGA